MRHIIFIFLIAVMGFVQSCDWLELTPVDNYSINNYWNNKDQVDRFIRGLHVRVRSRMNIFFKMGELRGGSLDGETSSAFSQSKSDVQAIRNTLSETYSVIGSWGNFYMDIMQINHAIECINTIDFLDENEKKYDLGILHGLRSFYYFHLFRTYGGVPIVEKPEVLAGVSSPDILNKARSSEKETYAFILGDIRKSDEYFRDDNFTINNSDLKSYWSKAATKMLKAEILLWGCKVKPIGESNVFSENVVADLQEAQKALMDILVSEKYGKLDNFVDVFAVSNENNQEIIFSIPYTLHEATNMFNQFLYPEANGNLGAFHDATGKKFDNIELPIDPLNLSNSGAISKYQYSEGFFKEFNEHDIRRGVTFMDVYRNVDNLAAILLVKFLGEFDESQFRRFTNDWPVYRYADLILMLAEIEEALGGDPAKYINEIRQRAYGDNFEAYKYPRSNETAEDAILEERMKEFVAEGKIWYDIRRMKGGQLAKELQMDVSGDIVEQHLLWPIDAATLSKDPLVEQTLGY